jgi:hypothetical protein
MHSVQGFARAYPVSLIASRMRINPAAADVAARVIDSAADLTDIEAETVFDIAGAMEAAFHQRLDPLLAGRARQGGKECVPFGLDVCIRWQACDVDQTLGVGDRLFVEGSDPHRQRVDEIVEFGVEKGAIDVAVERRVRH